MLTLSLMALVDPDAMKVVTTFESDNGGSDSYASGQIPIPK